MAAVEGTIVATAMPSIVGQLGGFALYSWVFSGYLLLSAITVPIYGKLSDLYGRKPIFAVGAGLFLIGSLLAGFAGSITALIVYRVIQGLGAGAIQPVTMTIIGDIYSIEERAKIQGFLASIWGISAVIGPTIGGFFVQYVSWSWVFWINIPIGILSVIGLFLFLHENVQHKKHTIDYLGSTLLFASISSLMLVLIQGGVTWSWTSASILGLIAVFIVAGVLFIQQEKRSPEPVMPLSIWQNPVILVANLASFTTGMIMIGISAYLPTFVQGVMGASPTTAGFTIAAMSLGWPLASTFSGKWLTRYGFRKLIIAGGIVLVVGAIFFVTLQPSYGPIYAGIGAFIIGVGMGLATTPLVVSVQSSVDWQMRGVATASNMFMRVLGSTVGAALLGGILNMRLIAYLEQQHNVNSHIPLSLDVTNLLLDPQKRSSLPADVLKALQDGLTIGLHSVYWGVFALAVISLAIMLFFPHSPIKKESSAK